MGLEMNPTSLTRENDVRLSLRDLVAPLFRCKRVLVLTCLSVFVVAALSGLRLQKYESHLFIVIGREGPTPQGCHRIYEADGLGNQSRS